MDNKPSKYFKKLLKLGKMFIDTHCHLQYMPIVNELDNVLKECKNKNVNIVVCVGTNMESSKQALRIVEEKKDNKIYASCGIHPTEVNSYSEFPIEDFVAILDTRNLNIIPFIGECGLDYFHKNTTKEQQINFLEHQIELAKKYNRIVIMHIRDAFEDIKSIVRNYLPFKFISHCFSGSWEDARYFLDNGGYISFALNITYPKNKNLIEVLKKVPEDRILFETDAPFLPPQQFRGRTNYPYYVIEGYKMASMLLEISISELADKIFENFKTLMRDVVDVI